MPRMWLVWLGILSVGQTGCEAGPGPVDDPVREKFEVGEPCSGKPGSTCQPDGSVLRCTEGHWRARDCESECGLETPWAGCLVTVQGGQCYCEGEVFDPFAYYEPFTRCVDAQTVLSCDEGRCREFACAEVCDQAGGLRSLGCIHVPTRDACYCTLEGTPCDETSTSPRCDSDAAIADCVDGQWVLESCDTNCTEGERGVCRLSADEPPSCECVLEGP